MIGADEVQSGAARTGKLFAMDHYADKPDLMTMAKSLAGRMPLSGVVGNANIMDAPAPGGLGGTYANRPLLVAAARSAQYYRQRITLRTPNQLGQRLKNTLIDTRSVPVFCGTGLKSMIAVEFNDPQTGNRQRRCTEISSSMAQGLLLLTCGAYWQRDSLPVSADHPDAIPDAAMKILRMR